MRVELIKDSDPFLIEAGDLLLVGGPVDGSVLHKGVHHPVSSTAYPLESAPEPLAASMELSVALVHCVPGDGGQKREGLCPCAEAVQPFDKEFL